MASTYQAPYRGCVIRWYPRLGTWWVEAGDRRVYRAADEEDARRWVDLIIKTFGEPIL